VPNEAFLAKLNAVAPDFGGEDGNYIPFDSKTETLDFENQIEIEFPYADKAINTAGTLYTKTGYSASDFVSLDGISMVYRYGSTAKYYVESYGLYDENKNFIRLAGNIAPTELEIINGQAAYVYDISGASYIRVVKNNSLTDLKFAVVPGQLTYKLSDSSISAPNIEKITKDVENLRHSSLLGKKIVNFGDSIFGLARPPYDISTVIANRTKATVYNCAFSGCCMAKHPTTSFDAFSMYRLATAITTNDFSLQDTYVSASEIPSHFTETLDLLKSIDFSEVDIVTISYGTNDFTAGLPVDSTNYPRNSGIFAGALRQSIEKLQTAYPNLRIFLLTPCYRFWNDDDGNFSKDVTDATYVQTWDGSNAQKLGDFAEKIKEVAKDYFLPVIDTYNVGIGKFNRTYYFPSNDTVHHNQDGRNLLGEFIAKHLY
jgi:lysophospholipase L1-like esterase